MVKRKGMVTAHAPNTAKGMKMYCMVSLPPPLPAVALRAMKEMNAAKMTSTPMMSTTVKTVFLTRTFPHFVTAPTGPAVFLMLICISSPHFYVSTPRRFSQRRAERMSLHTSLLRTNAGKIAPRQACIIPDWHKMFPLLFYSLGAIIPM